MKRLFILLLAGAAMFASCDKDNGGDDTPATYTIAITAKATQGSATATVDDAKADEAAEGATVTLTATAATGYKFKKWTVTAGGDLFTPTGPSPFLTPTTFTMPAQNVAITAEFEFEVDPATIFGDGITAAADYASGSGTAGDPWVIATAAQLKKLVDDSHKAATAERHILLATDILVTAAQWTPISSPTVPFWGSFDGGGHTISGVTVNTTDAQAGLFRWIASGSSVRNLTLDGVSVSGKDRVGGIVGENNGTIENCRLTGASTVTGTGDRVGGIAGWNTRGATVSLCYSLAASVSVKNRGAGGIVGRNSPNGTTPIVSKCFWLKETGTAGDDQPGAAIGLDESLSPAAANTPADCASHTTETAVIAAWNTAQP